MQPAPKVKALLSGNSGAGKSFVGNGIVSQAGATARFTSQIAAGRVTTSVERIATPGGDDAMVANRNELMKALRLGGAYILVHVLSHQNMRPIAADLQTLAEVVGCFASRSTQMLIIINMVPQATAELRQTWHTQHLTQYLRKVKGLADLRPEQLVLLDREPDGASMLSAASVDQVLRAMRQLTPHPVENIVDIVTASELRERAREAELDKASITITLQSFLRGTRQVSVRHGAPVSLLMAEGCKAFGNGWYHAHLWFGKWLDLNATIQNGDTVLFTQDFKNNLGSSFPNYQLVFGLAHTRGLC